MSDKTDTNNGFQKLFLDVKDYVGLRMEYLQVGLVEKLTKLISKLLILFACVILSMAILFYLLFSLAYALAPALGFIASFAIIAGGLFLLLMIVVLFRKQLIINPILRLMVDLFYDETKPNQTENENDATTV